MEEIRHVWDWKKKAEKMFGKGRVKVFRRDGKQYACVIGPVGDTSCWEIGDFDLKKQQVRAAD
jgi:hypothetical protein